MGQSKLYVIVICVSIFAVIAVFAYGRFGQTDSTAAEFVQPNLSLQAVRGKAAFENSCASCHGVNAVGTDKGPPFLHAFYNPGHHGDESFRRAVTAGVRQHHWPYGDMPAQPSVIAEDLEDIIRYVRELQSANGFGPAQH